MAIRDFSMGLNDEVNEDTLKFHKEMRRLLGLDITGGDPGTSGGNRTLADKLKSAMGLGGSGGSGSGILSLLSGALGSVFGIGGSSGGTSSAGGSYAGGNGGSQATALSGSKESFIQGILPYAQEANSKYGIPMAQILGQAAFESGWGTSNNAREANNLFGMRGTGKSNEYWSGDVRQSSSGAWRKYSGVRESVMDYARNLHDNYGINGGEWQNTLKSILPKYCPDAGYYDNVAKIITSNGLDQYRKGTAWLPEDQIAMVHKGEMIVPAEHNPMNADVPTESVALADYKANSEGVEDVSSVVVYNNNSQADYTEIIGAISSAVKTISAKLDEVISSNTSRNRQKPSTQTNTGFLYSL